MPASGNPVPIGASEPPLGSVIDEEPQAPTAAKAVSTAKVVKMPVQY